MGLERYTSLLSSSDSSVSSRALSSPPVIRQACALAMATTSPAPTPETPITVKINLASGENRRFKLPLRDCGANTLPEKVCSEVRGVS